MADSNDTFLKDEYLKLQDQYEDYDRRALHIKGWIGAAAITGFALGIDSNKNIDNRTLLIIGAIAICFWYLEASWKTFQYAISDRIRVLEAHFRQDKDILIKDPKPFQIYSWWFKAYFSDEPIYPYEFESRPSSLAKRFFDAALLPFVHLPYSLILAICVLTFIWQVTHYPN